MEVRYLTEKIRMEVVVKQSKKDIMKMLHRSISITSVSNVRAHLDVFLCLV